MDESEYTKRQDERRNDDFIVDDEGIGYRDFGGEIWEQEDDGEEEGAKRKKRKIDVILPSAQPLLTKFSTMSKRLLVLCTRQGL